MPKCTLSVELVVPASLASRPAAMVSEQSLKQWLDTLKPGWAERFGSAFDAVGIEDISDLAGIDGSVVAALVDELQSIGAKLLHVQRIEAAIRGMTVDSRRVVTLEDSTSLSEACAETPFVSSLSQWSAQQMEEIHAPLVRSALRNSLQLCGLVPFACLRKGIVASS